MPMREVRISIGGREFDVGCEDGEEHFLKSAADLLDREAQILADQMGRIPEGRMLLMAGLMLADKMAAMEEQVRALEARAAEAEADAAAAASRPPERMEVAVIPEEVTERLAELAARAEAMAQAAEEMTAG